MGSSLDESTVQTETPVSAGKHTPGPWSAKPSADTGYGDPEWAPFQIESDEWIVAVAIGDVDDLNAEANARLIAAAPDLLEALSELIEANSFYFKPGNPWGDKARAAIAKAVSQ